MLCSLGMESLVNFSEPFESKIECQKTNHGYILLSPKPPQASLRAKHPALPPRCERTHCWRQLLAEDGMKNIF